MRARNAAIVAGFIDERSFRYNCLDRNAKARLLHSLDAFERATKRPGCCNGELGRCTLIVARCLLLRFANAKTARCFPSYDAIQEATGLCRATVATALRALEDVGALKITRRLTRARDAVGNLFARQASNLYSFAELPRLIPVGLAALKARPFPPRRVHAVGRNSLQGVFDEVKRAKLRADSGASDWRERARAAISR